MPKDAIFRIYSMSKAVTGVAVMILHDQGKFSLDDPVAKFLPEFASPKVAIEEKDPQTGKRAVRLVDAERAITILDLLRHTSGINYLGPKDNDGESYYRNVDVRDPSVTLEEKIKRLAKAPLVHQPGTTWEYGFSIDVLGRLVEVVSGLPLDQYFDTRILQPLRMVDTGFSVPESKWDRLVTLDTPAADGTVRRSEGPAQDQFKKPATWFSGGGGLVGTTMDYARFCQMLLNEGELDGVRILSQRAVRMMHTDHLGDLPRTGPLLAATPALVSRSESARRPAARVPRAPTIGVAPPGRGSGSTPRRTCSESSWSISCRIPGCTTATSSRSLCIKRSASEAEAGTPTPDKGPWRGHGIKLGTSCAPRRRDFSSWSPGFSRSSGPRTG